MRQGDRYLWMEIYLTYVMKTSILAQTALWRYLSHTIAYTEECIGE